MYKYVILCFLSPVYYKYYDLEKTFYLTTSIPNPSDTKVVLVSAYTCGGSKHLVGVVVSVPNFGLPP